MYYCSVAVSSLSCSSTTKEDPNALPLTLVRRSVLDQKIRMLTLRFGEDRFLTYDLEHGRLHKVWRGGVLWNGAVFNNLKTVQPTSYGSSYWEAEENQGEWQIEENGDRSPAKAIFQGYIWEAGRMELKFRIESSDKAVSIIERPQFLEAAGIPYLTRTVEVQELMGNLILYYAGQEIIHEEKHIVKRYVTAVISHLQSLVQPVSTNASQYWLERTGCSTCHAQSEKTIGPSYEAIAGRYESSDENVENLIRSVKNGSSGKWGSAVMIPHPTVDVKDIKRMILYILSLQPSENSKQNKPKVPQEITEEKTPGFGAPVAGVHPSFDLINFRPASFKPRVGGLAFLPDGQLLVSTWDSIGALYALSGVQTGDSNQVDVRLMASGLSEPLGLTTVGEDIFVLQKHELTQLIDTDNDGVVNEYRSINHSFGATPDFHEFSYGLIYRDGYFYGNLGLAMRLMSTEFQHPDRGTAFKAGLDGSFELIANGLRQANGIGLGPENEIFLTENQGQWSPACKLIHLQKDRFYGCQYGTGDRFAGRTASPPAVWLPQHEIGNSPSEPVHLDTGPYRDQMIFGEVTHGGIKRVYLEKIAGEYQGCVFRFSQGLEAGVNRLVWGPDGALYVGGVGMVGNWGHLGKQHGLQKLVYNGNIPFELLAVRAQSDGFMLHFTKPLAEETLVEIEDKIRVQQWYYEATPAYGGPKLGLQELKIVRVIPKEDNTQLQLTIPDLQAGHIIYFNLDSDIRSLDGAALWSGEAWYTLNNIPGKELQ